MHPRKCGKVNCVAWAMVTYTTTRTLFSTAAKTVRQPLAGPAKKGGKGGFFKKRGQSAKVVPCGFHMSCGEMLALVGGQQLMPLIGKFT